MCSLPPVEYDETGGKACTLRVTLSQTSKKENLMSVCSVVVCTLRRVCSPTGEAGDIVLPWMCVKTGSPQVLLGGPGGQGTRVEVSPDTSRA